MRIGDKISINGVVSVMSEATEKLKCSTCKGKKNAKCDNASQCADKKDKRTGVKLPNQKLLKKKKASLSKKALTLVLTLTAAFLIAVIVTTVCCLVFLRADHVEMPTELNNIYGFSSLAMRPADNHITVDLTPYASDKEKAAYLYLLAGYLSKMSPTTTAYTQGQLCMTVLGSDNYIDISGLILKNEQQYYRSFYQIANSVPLLDNPLFSVAAKKAVTSERYYYDSHLDKMQYQMVYNNRLDEKGIPSADWGQIDESTTMDIPVYNAQQFGIFSVTNHTVKVDTIDSATVEYNEQGGYYMVSLLLDVNNPDATAYSVADIRDGTGDKSAVYSKVQIDFTVWDNGYMRDLYMDEIWDARVVVKLNFDLATHYYFSYNPKDCRMDAIDEARKTIEYFQ